MRLALLNNAGLLSAEQDVEISRQRVKESRYLFYPELGFGLNAVKFEVDRTFALPPEFGSILLFPSTRENLYSGRAYLLQSLYDGGRTRKTLTLAKSALKQNQARYDAVRLDVIENAKRVFYGFLLSQEKAQLAEQKLAEAETISGSLSLGPWEKVEAETVLNQLRIRKREMDRRMEKARLEYLKELNLEPGTSVKAEGDLQERDLEEGLEKLQVWAVEMRPELRSEVYRAEMDATAVSLALARRIPTVSLGAGYEFIDQDFPLRQSNWNVTVGVRFPFSYDFWTQIRRKRAEQRQGQIQRSELQDKVRLEVLQAYSEADFWQKERPQRAADWKKAEGMFQEARTRAGVSLQALRSLTSVMEAHLQYLAAVEDHLLARARLERVVGKEL